MIRQRCDNTAHQKTTRQEQPGGAVAPAPRNAEGELEIVPGVDVQKEREQPFFSRARRPREGREPHHPAARGQSLRGGARSLLLGSIAHRQRGRNVNGESQHSAVQFLGDSTRQMLKSRRKSARGRGAWEALTACGKGHSWSELSWEGSVDRRHALPRATSRNEGAGGQSGVKGSGAVDRRESAGARLRSPPPGRCGRGAPSPPRG